MRKQILILMLLTSTLIGAQEYKSLDNDTIISWNKNRKLQWDDFKAVKDADDASFNDAKTTYKLEILPEIVQVDEQDRIYGYERMSIATYFYKKMSWTVKRDPSLLAHEQVHFDIAELFARKMRKAFSELKKKKINTFGAYQNTYHKFWEACKKYQKQFNAETRNGIDTVSDLEWIEKIEKELDELKAYALR